MVKKPTQWPRRGELVIGTVRKVNPFSVFVTLEEYGKKEGMIHISEVARKWIKDIRKFVKEGKKIVVLVMNVDKEKRHITLSLKRVSRYDAEGKMKEYKREIKGEKMLQAVAKEKGIRIDTAYKEIGFKLQEEFGEIFKAFQTALTDKGYDLLLKRGIPEDWAKIIKNVAQKQMEIKESTIKCSLELKCFKSDGVEIIKKSLIDAAKKYKLNINYISAPNYSISIKTKDAKQGEKILKEAAENIIKNIKSSGGEGNFNID